VTDALSRLDLAFCVDLTGSMSGFIAAAKQHMARVLDALKGPLGDGLRVAVVGYRDHSDGPKLLEIHPLDGDLAAVSAAVQQLSVGGGGDAPEAVYAGLKACLELNWREGSYRVVILVGDAPPHAVGAPGDAYAKGDPTGYSLDDMANQLETEGLFVHALSMQPRDQLLASSFQRLSISTGGGYYDATGTGAAIRIVEAITQSLLQEIDFDRTLLARLREGVKVPQPKDDDELVPSRAQLLAKLLKVEVPTIHSGMMRLRRRHLLKGLDD
jgi:hypothetical protein